MIAILRRSTACVCVIVALTVWVAVETIAPCGERTPIASGVALLAIAGWVAAR